MDRPPPLPKPLVTYHLCSCEEADCKRLPMRGTEGPEGERVLRRYLERLRAGLAS